MLMNQNCGDGNDNKSTSKESLLRSIKRFSIMTDIQFAKEHLGEYFQYRGYRNYKVRVIGYDATGVDKSVLIDYLKGWGLELADPSDVINENLCETGRCFYVNWEDLR